MTGSDKTTHDEAAGAVSRAPLVDQKRPTPDHDAGPSGASAASTTPTTAARLMRAADALTQTEGGPSSVSRARSMNVVQRSLGNARVGRLVQRKLTTAQGDQTEPEADHPAGAVAGGLPDHTSPSAA